MNFLNTDVFLRDDKSNILEFNISAASAISTRVLFISVFNLIHFLLMATV